MLVSRLVLQGTSFVSRKSVCITSCVSVRKLRRKDAISKAVCAQSICNVCSGGKRISVYSLSSYLSSSGLLKTLV